MAEAFLEVVLDNLVSLIKEEIGLIMGVNEEMQKLQSTLTTIQAVLEDAEDRQVESKPIRDWLRKLNALAYEIDDILDECVTHVSKLKQGNKFSRYSLKKTLYRLKIGRRMKQVSEKLDSVAAERAKFHLREMPVDRPREIAASRETGSLLNESDRIFGREEAREEIVKILVNDVKDKQEISVLPIIGVGGLGKTTLAQLVFNDSRVQKHFDKRIWVCVSDNFDIKTLVKAMIESGTGSGKASDLQHLDALERRLWELLSQKRYLVVLDDVWNDQQHKWLELRDLLSCGSAGASVIVTTRQRKVGDIMRTLPAHYLSGLSEEDCWMLLKRHAFGQDEDVHPNLEVIGKQIVTKCGGAPLAAKALGGILRFKRKEKEWMYVRESDMWKEEESLILPTLRLSYHHLPLQLRQCFAYFAAFPKDHMIEREELIRLWMAHGYISSKGKLEVEDVGSDICDELVLRSLFQQGTTHHILHPLRTNYRRYVTNQTYYVSMHDLVHDLAQSIMENKVPGKETESNTPSASTIREVSLRERTVLFPKNFHQDMDISFVLEHTSLRVLNASRTEIKDLPSSIANLKHLRSLDLSGSKIRTLPNSLCKLWNLQILKLDYCNRLEVLPKHMRYLSNLRHLCLDSCNSLSEMPPRIRELTLLKTLSKFVVGRKSGNQLEELQYLNLGGRLEIRGLERVKDHMDAKRACLSEKKNLRILRLSWGRNGLFELGEDVDEKVLESLQPHENLESLSIRGYNGRCTPLWISTLEKLVELNIGPCRNCASLPKLGELPFLRTLRLQNLAVEYIIEDETRNGNPVKIKFPSLKLLRLRGLPNLKGLSNEQESNKAFPNLENLLIKDCSSVMLPPLSSLPRLETLACNNSTLALLSEMDVLIIKIIDVEIEEKLTCFPVETLVKFSNLKELRISGAKEISVAGAGEALHALNRLYNFALVDCKTMTCLPKGLLQHFTALKHLNLESCLELVELPEEIKHLNLESIYLYGLLKMARLPEALQSLKYLYLNCLPRLVSLPALPNLKYLHVDGCPELEKRCSRDTGKDWYKIAHIPHLRIGRKFFT